jgi:hypothetical protein
MAQAHAHFSALVRNLRAGTLTLPNTNFDTGRPAQAGEYALADKTHAEWLEALAKHDFERASPPVRLALEAFYRGGRDARDTGLPTPVKFPGRVP